jgi:adenylate cyclase
MKRGLSVSKIFRKLLRVNAATITIAIVLLGMAAYQRVPFLDLMELKTVDLRFRSRGPLPTGPEVVLAVVDEKSLEEQGKWVWPRSKFGQLIRLLSESGAKVIAFDVGFLEPDQNNTVQVIDSFESVVNGLGIEDDRLGAYLKEARHWADNDLILAEAIRESKAKVVLGFFLQMNPEGLEGLDESAVEKQMDGAQNARYKFTRSPPNTSVEVEEVMLNEAFVPQSNIPIIAKSAKYSGYFNMLPDQDGSVRWVPLVIRCRKRLLAPLSIQALSAYTRRSAAPLVADYGVQGIEIGRLFAPTDEVGRLMVNYRGPGRTFPHISITDILHNRVSPDTFKDRIVLVGATAIGIYDMRVTPLSEIFPGIEIHANVIDNILRQDCLQRPEWARFFDLAAILSVGLSLGLLVPRLRALPGAAVTVAFLVSYIILCQYLFSHRGAWLNMVYPAAVLMLTYVSLTVYRYLTEERQKRFIKDAFSTYLAPSVVAQLIKSPERLVLGGEERVITAFFSDVQAFTSISETLTPKELVELLNEFLTEMTEVILGYEGTVDKFEGDAIIAFFGAPNILQDHAARACQACIDMQKRLVELRAMWKAENRPELKMRIGLNTGSAVVGNMGSKNRMDYTMMGDMVNTAARLEGVNKVYGTYTMISDATYMSAKEEIFVREIDTVNVVGKGEPLTVYELLGYPREVDERVRSVMQHYLQGLGAYRERSWDSAIGHFSAALAVDPHDGPSQALLNRCKDFKVNPPDTDWDGAFTLTMK